MEVALLFVDVKSVNDDEPRYMFTARRYASAVYVIVVCLSVRPTVCPSVPKRLNVESRKQRHTIAQGLYLSDSNNLGEIPTGLLSRASCLLLFRALQSDSSNHEELFRPALSE